MASVDSSLPAADTSIAESSRHSERLKSEASPIHLKKLLVPTDFSPNAEKALRYGLRLAQLGQATLLLLHVFEIPQFAELLPQASSWQLDYVEIKKTFDSAIQRAKLKLAELARTAEEKNVKVHTEVCQGTPYEEIVRVAKEEEVELIVIATHGYTGLKHFMVGSTAERVVRVAPCPVLIVREGERDFVF
jgi:nucleotide-binding universal stress UspA family protein